MHSDLYVQLGLLQDMKKDCKSDSTIGAIVGISQRLATPTPP